MMKLKPLLFVGVLILSTAVILYQVKIEKIRIPGSEVDIELAYISGGNLKKDKTSINISPFWMSTTEVTFDAFTLFQQKVNDSNESTWTEGKFRVDAVSRPTPQYIDYTFGMGSTGGFPAVSATQQGALRFCEWLYFKTGVFFRLPTEAEWELACLGKKKKYKADDNNTWNAQNSSEKYHQVARKEANDFGLFDMLGNVAEWTLDDYQADYLSAIPSKSDPWIKPASKHGRTVKGGSYQDAPENCNCQSRMRSTAKWQERDPNLPKSIWWNTDAPFVGFRLVKPVKQPNKDEVFAFFKEAIVIE